MNVPFHTAFTHFSQYNTSIHFMKNFCCKTKGQICYFQLAFSCSKTKTNTYTKVFIVLENACDKQTVPLVLSYSSWHINRPKTKGVEFGPTVPAKWIQFAAISNPTIPSRLRTGLQNAITSRSRVPNSNYGTLRIHSL